MQLRFLNRELEAGSKYLTTELRASNDILEDVEALRVRMAEDGYLLIRGLHNRDPVLAARQQILEQLAQRGMLAPDAPLGEGVYNPAYSQPATTSTTQYQELTRLPAFRTVVEGQPIMDFCRRFLGGEVRTFDYKWLRAAGPGAVSPIHCDIVFMGRGTRRLFTCWTPFGDISLDMGPLVLCLGSHRFEQVKQTYGQSDVDRDLIAGYFSEDPVELVDQFGGRWATTEFQAGDVVLFGMYTLHASLTNTSDKVRLSADTRYQLASEPADERWVGEKPLGHYAWQQPDAQIEPLAKSRARWGV